MDAQQQHKNNDSSLESSAESLVSVLGGAISKERAEELLEASNGSIERAVDLHFNDNDHHHQIEIARQNDNDDDEVAILEGNDAGKPERAPTTTKEKKNMKETNNRTQQSTMSPSNKRRRLQTTLEAFVQKSPPPAAAGQQLNKKKKKENSPTRQAATPPSRQSAGSESVVVAKAAPNQKSPNRHDTPANDNRNDNDLKQHHIPYSLVVQQLSIVSNNTKRTIKLEALRSLFRQILSIFKGATEPRSGGGGSGSGGDDDEATMREKACILHMVLDLLLGKITILTITDATAEAPPSDSAKSLVNLTLQASGAAVSKALQVVLGISKSQMREMYRRLGDMGDVAAEAAGRKTSVKSFFTTKVSSSSSSKKPASTTVESVHASLQSLATVPVGKGSVAARHNLLIKLFRSAQNDKDTLRFLVRTVLGNMRIGATLKTILAALAESVQEQQQEQQQSETEPKGETASAKEDGSQIQTKRSVSERLQKVFNVCPRLNEICLALLRGGIERAEQDCTLSLGCPVEPMLANPAHSLEQVEEFLRKSQGSTAIAEWKYDGVRCQAHCDDRSVKLFSRNLLDQTDQYPDAALYFLEAASKSGCSSFICDAEIVAVAPSVKEGSDISSFRLLPFQDLRRGASKAAESTNGQVAVFCFDLLYLNGKSLLKLPLSARQQLLRENFTETRSFAFAQSTPLPSLKSSTPFDQTLITDALTTAVNAGAEGLMVKLTGFYDNINIDSAEPGPRPALGFYESGTRSNEWLKVKRDYVGGTFADTIDVVPIGAWYGNGRKAKAGFLSPILLAVYDDDDGVYRSISRCMSFSDEMYIGMKNFYLKGLPYPDLPDTADADAAKAKTGDENRDDEQDDSGSENLDEHPKSDNGVDTEDEEEPAFVNCFTERPPSTVIVTNESPPIWFKPSEVFEVSFADLSLSRTHTAAGGLVGDPEGRGVALRFPRFKRRRPDKSPEQATTSADVSRLFYQQSKTAYQS